MSGSHEGERRKAVALALLEAHRERFLVRARRLLLAHLINKGPSTVEAIRPHVPLPYGLHPSVWGAVPGPLARLRLIRRRSFVQSARRARRAAHVAEWELVDAERARQWLAAHPEPLAFDGGQGELFPTPNEGPRCGNTGAN